MNLSFGIEILSRLDQFTVQKCQNWALLKWFYSLFWPSVKLCELSNNREARKGARHVKREERANYVQLDINGDFCIM